MNYTNLMNIILLDTYIILWNWYRFFTFLFAYFDYLLNYVHVYV